MDHSVLNSNDFHKSMSVSTNMNDLHLDHRYFISCAGCDITKDARVNLLYEIPLTLLARRFIAEDGGHFNKLKILVSLISDSEFYLRSIFSGYCFIEISLYKKIIELF